MKKAGFILILALCATVLTGCTTKSNIEANIAQIDQEETYPEILGQLDVVYEDIETMAEDATVIAEVSATERKVVVLAGFPQTHTMVNVKKVYKGSVNINDSLEVVEEGGYDGKVAGGLPQLNFENDYTLFLIEYKGCYYICGAFQGRFIEREGYFFQQATADVKLDTYSPLSIADFSNELMDLVVQKNVEEK